MVQIGGREHCTIGFQHQAVIDGTCLPVRQAGLGNLAADEYHAADITFLVSQLLAVRQPPLPPQCNHAAEEESKQGARHEGCG